MLLKKTLLNFNILIVLFSLNSCLENHIIEKNDKIKKQKLLAHINEDKKFIENNFQELNQLKKITDQEKKSEALKNMVFLSGSPEREELEFKSAFSVESEKTVIKIIEDFKNALKLKLSKNNFNFSKQIHNNYYTSPSFERFAFLDYYFDTQNHDILKKNSAYRLRYRWSKWENFKRYQYFPFFKFFFPTRVEVQFKRDYQHTNHQQMKVFESRFEFRKESLPFSKGFELPKAPWPLVPFLDLASHGQYQQHIMIPSYNLKKILPNADVQINPISRATTKRYRNHLNIKNPWGTGPNPDQVFILSFDYSNFQGIDKSNHNNQVQFLEVEIELDRNISREINRLSKESKNKEVRSFSQIAKNNLMNDLNLVQETLQSILLKYQDKTSKNNLFHIKKLPINYKYKRFMLNANN